VDVPDVFTQAFAMEKDSKRFPKSGAWGIRAVQLRRRIRQVHGRSQKLLRLRTRVPSGREGERLQVHFPSVPEALNRVACPPTSSTRRDAV
jgi:hypothetical protein